MPCRIDEGQPRQRRSSAFGGRRTSSLAGGLYLCGGREAVSGLAVGRRRVGLGRLAANYYRREYLYAEAVRLIYKAVSDLASLFRERKEGGYSRWGPLNPLGRAIIFNAVKASEELAGRPIFYGLDKARIWALTLRRIFYQMSPEKADRIIAKIDPTPRRVPVAHLRDLSRHKDVAVAIETLRLHIASTNHRGEEIDKALDDILMQLKRTKN